MARIHPHDLRYTHASLVPAADVHAKVVQERLGHAPASVSLDTCSRAILAPREEAAAKAAAAVFG